MSTTFEPKNASKPDKGDNGKINKLIRKFEANVDENLKTSKEKIQRKDIRKLSPKIRTNWSKNKGIGEKLSARKTSEKIKLYNRKKINTENCNSKTNEIMPRRKLDFLGKENSPNKYASKVKLLINDFEDNVKIKEGENSKLTDENCTLKKHKNAFELLMENKGDTPTKTPGSKLKKKKKKDITISGQKTRKLDFWLRKIS